MITIYANGYTLRQIKGQGVTYVTFPGGDVRKVIGPKLTQESALSIIISAGEP